MNLRVELPECEPQLSSLQTVWLPISYLATLCHSLLTGGGEDNVPTSLGCHGD